MSRSESRSGDDPEAAEVLTLAETATYLRSPEEAVRELVEKGLLPAQRIGSEWRLLKRAVAAWLRAGPHSPPEFRPPPLPWMIAPHLWEDLIHVIEQRILSKLPAPERRDAEPGSKQAVLRHFGVFKDDADIEKQLAGIRARREAAGE